MTLSVSIEPLVPAIDMYDSPDTNSAYSLSGHITIAASPSSSILALPRSSPHNLLLTALELTFEGQSELVLPEIGYAPLRLLSITKQLVEPAHPVQITTDDAHAEWRVVFNLPVPGWLPASAVFGDHDGQGPTGVSYALYARARFHVAPADADDPAAPAAAGASPSSMWNNLCSVVRGAPRPRLVQAEKVAIRVTRYVSPPARAYHRAEGAAPPPFPRSTFAVQALSECAAGEAQATNIPAEILRAVELHAIVPSRTAVGDDTLPLLLRLRSRSPEEAARSRLRVMAFEANVVQVERYHASPSASFAARFPIPPAAQQPPHVPLRSAHPVGTLFEMGLIGLPPQGQQALVHERSITPDGASKHFKVRGGEDEPRHGGVAITDTWLRMQVDVPVSPGLQTGDEETAAGKRVSGESPFFDVKHELRIRLTVGCAPPADADADADGAADELAFTVPLEFVRVTPAAAAPRAAPFFPVLAHTHACSTASLPLPHPPMAPVHAPSPSASRERTRTRSLSAIATDASASTPLPPPPPPPALPAYSQLFHENGERKDDMRGALPLYREKEEAPAPEASSASPASSTASLEDGAAGVPSAPRVDPAAAAAAQPPARRAAPAARTTAQAPNALEGGAALGMFASMGVSVPMLPPRRARSAAAQNVRVSVDEAPPRVRARRAPSPSPSEDGDGDGAALGMFASMGISVPMPPRLERTPSLDSPVSPGMPLTPPGLAPQEQEREREREQGKHRGRREGNPKGRKRGEMVFGESFLRLDEDGDGDAGRGHVRVRAAVAHQRTRTHPGDGDRDRVRGEVQYGIAL